MNASGGMLGGVARGSERVGGGPRFDICQGPFAGEEDQCPLVIQIAWSNPRTGQKIIQFFLGELIMRGNSFGEFVPGPVVIRLALN